MYAAALLFLAVMTPLDKVAEEDAQKELAKLQGVWKITSRETSGHQMRVAPPTADRYTLIIVGDSYVFMRHAGTIKLDTAKRPRPIDFIVNEGAYKGRTALGLIEQNGDTLQLALQANLVREQPRPTALKTEKAQYTLYTFERDAKATKEAAAEQLKQMKAAVAANGPPLGRVGGGGFDRGRPDPINERVGFPNQDALQKILDRLDQIDKRLEEIEKRLPQRANEGPPGKAGPAERKK